MAENISFFKLRIFGVMFWCSSSMRIGFKLFLGNVQYLSLFLTKGKRISGARFGFDYLFMPPS